MLVMHSVSVGTLLGNFIIVTGSFLTLMILIRIFAWSKITGIFDDRAKQISDDLAKAEEARVKAEGYVSEQEQVLKDSRLEASQIIGQANARAAHDKEAILTQAKEEAQSIKDKAREDAEAIKVEAVESAKEEIAALAIDLAERILVHKLNETERETLVDRYLDRLGEN
ncbi:MULTISPECIES: F0F1 ATP synthase subunit B [Streptococcus]|uniref:ATP synthase subunit b n=1 Tax=Streptococcus caledonicus TaxID=2614158 RepID=A0ABW0UA91_9STRE|nr:F0F1 ATP synthase subunit B [Streptococcus sp. S784/96/1]